MAGQPHRFALIFSKGGEEIQWDLACVSAAAVEYVIARLSKLYFSLFQLGLPVSTS